MKTTQPDHGKELRAFLSEFLTDYSHLYRIIFSKPPNGRKNPVLKVTIEPVKIRDEIVYQYTHYDEKKAIVKNHSRENALEALENVLETGFRYVNILTDHSTVQVDCVPDGPMKVKKTLPQAAATKIDFIHDRQKQDFITPDNAKEALAILGFSAANGGIKPGMQKKFRQVNEFIRIFEESTLFRLDDPAAPEIIDCGSGSAYLTFFLYQYLTRIKGKNARLTGIDRDPDAVMRSSQKAKTLAFDGVKFIQSAISAYTPVIPPFAVLSLHACDTATDEAIANAVRWGSRLILCAPCCHHHLNLQLKEGNGSSLVQPLTGYGLLLEKLGDVLTDTFRALVLSIMGYNVNIVKFVDPENTERNVMIKAEKQDGIPVGKYVRQYLDMKKTWMVTPFLEQELGEPFLEKIRNG